MIMYSYTRVEEGEEEQEGEDEMDDSDEEDDTDALWSWLRRRARRAARGLCVFDSLCPPLETEHSTAGASNSKREQRRQQQREPTGNS